MRKRREINKEREGAKREKESGETITCMRKKSERWQKTKREREREREKEERER